MLQLIVPEKSNVREDIGDIEVEIKDYRNVDQNIQRKSCELHTREVWQSSPK